MIGRVNKKPPGHDSVRPDKRTYRVPAVYSFRFFVAAGGLISYGNDLTEQVREAATYIDRLLRGAAASELPVQAPTKYELIINLRTAKEMADDAIRHIRQCSRARTAILPVLRAWRRS